MKAAAAGSDAALAHLVLDARQLALKLCANAARGYCGADTSSLSGPPLAEACLRWGRASAAARPRASSKLSRGPSGASYAATDSVFVEMPGGCSVSDAVAAGEAAGGARQREPIRPRASISSSRRCSRRSCSCTTTATRSAEHTRASLAARRPPELHIKGLLERSQAEVVRRAVEAALHASARARRRAGSASRSRARPSRPSRAAPSRPTAS